MIESLHQSPTLHSHSHDGKNNEQASKKRVLSMVQNERTAGSIPAWHPAKTAKQNIESTLAQPGQKAEEFSSALAYQDHISQNEAQAGTEEEFGFADLVDMVNPLQHIPIVSHIYREITDDEIKPIGKIIGGAVFGGPVGAAGGLVNVIVEEETGKDLLGNALSLTHEKEVTTFDIKPLPEALPERQPITTLDMEELTMESAKAETQTVYDDLPAVLLAFADTGGPKIKTISRETGYIEAAQGRTAGYIRRFS